MSGHRNTRMDAVADLMIPVAASLVGNVRERDQAAIAKTLKKLPPERKDALIVVLAAMVPDFVGVVDLLAWVQETHAGDAKKCWRCGEKKPRALFTRDRTKPDGHRGECSTCSSASRRRRRAAA